MKLSELKAWSRNPREISDAAAQGLGESIERFGDLSGIVYNTRNDALVCGHQRIDRIRSLCGDANPEIQRVDDEYGVLFVGPHTFRIRFVDWDEETHQAANVVANNPFIAGEFNDDLEDLLKEMNEQDAELFQLLQFDKLSEELGVKLKDNTPSAPEDFREVDESIDTEHTCPKCGYKWSGGE